MKQKVPLQLPAGQAFEAKQLAELGLEKNNRVWRPTIEETNTATFRLIVGEPKYTPKGSLKGTIFDASSNGFLEIKGGTSELVSSYQLRLQVYRSLMTDTKYTIRTTRPVNPTFAEWLERWGAMIDKVENPG
jgi:hypothetical protein